MKIEYDFTEKEFLIAKQSVLEQLLEQIYKDFDQEASDINYIFCNDDYLLDINRTYLNHDYYTDVITFESAHPNLPSDIFISTERVAENAEKYNISFSDELARVMIHGVLHLCGMEDGDKIQAQEMRDKEDYYLKLLEKQ